MRVLQLIDSLEPGGAERMAVNYANALSKEIAFSGIVVTRAEGELKSQLHNTVGYLYLNRKKTVDFSAIFKLRKFVKNNGVSIIHAHSSSFFIAVLFKLTLPSVKILWHDHYGNSEFLNQRKKTVLSWLSFLFSGIIVVNENLMQWARLNLHCKKIIYLPNFVCFDQESHNETKLMGKDGKRVVMLANLRPQKNHLLLLAIVQRLDDAYHDWTFHLIGKDFEDDYSKVIISEIYKRKLSEKVFVYGSKNDVSNIMRQCEIGVLTSKSEGLPVSVLEYGYSGLAVISTNVGAISTVIDDASSGFLVPSDDVQLFSEKLSLLMSDSQKRQNFGKHLQKVIFDGFTEQAVLEKYLEFIKQRIEN